MKREKKSDKRREERKERVKRYGTENSLYEAIEKRYGKGIIGKPTTMWKTSSVEVISTGSFKIDQALGIGGLPRGRMVELFGAEGGGKTTLSLTTIATAQRAGERAAFIDAEHALSLKLASNVGVNVEELTISQPEYGEQTLDILEMLVASGLYAIIVVDSVAALVPKAELEGDLTDADVAGQARMIGKSMRKLVAAISKNKVCVIFINQLRSRPMITFGDPDITPGGRALKFFSSIRLDIRRISAVKDKSSSMPIGNKVKIKVVKNKLASPFRVVETELLFGYGFNIEGELIDVATQHGIVERDGNTYLYGKRKLGKGMSKVRTRLREDKELFDQILGDIDLAEAENPMLWD